MLSWNYILSMKTRAFNFGPLWQQWSLWENNLRRLAIAASFKSLMRLVTRKPVFGVCNQSKLKPACSASETS